MSAVADQFNCHVCHLTRLPRSKNWQHNRRRVGSDDLGVDIAKFLPHWISGEGVNANQTSIVEVTRLHT